MTEEEPQTLSPHKWTKKFAKTTYFPCSDEEAMKAILNVGLYIARKCIIALIEGKSAKEQLPYIVDTVEVEDLVTHISLKEQLGKILIEDVYNTEKISLTQLRLTVIRDYSDKGIIEEIPKDLILSGNVPPKYLKSCPELENNHVFKNKIDRMEITHFDETGHKSVFRINVRRCSAKDQLEYGSFIVRGARLIDGIKLVELRCGSQKPLNI